MAIYLNVPTNEAYKLLSSGALILVSTSDIKGNMDIAPIAWQCPVDDEPVTKLLFVTGFKNKAYVNAKEKGKFVICIPHANQMQLVRDLVKCSGFEKNKFEIFDIEYSLSEKCQYPVPNGCMAYIECKLIRAIEEESMAIVIGEVIIAKAIKGCYRDRLISEKEMAKTIHFLGKDRFFQPGDLID